MDCGGRGKNAGILFSLAHNRVNEFWFLCEAQPLHFPSKEDKMPPDPNVNQQPENSASKPPWERINEWIWEYLRKTRAGRLIALWIVALVAVGWLIGQFETLNKLPGYLRKDSTYATPDEITCLNEWVLRLAGENSQTAAEQTRAKFVNDYKDFGHVNLDGEPIWINDVHVVRDLEHAGEWLVVIDMYPGASTQECMKSGKDEMVAVLNNKPPEQERDWDNRIGRLLRPAEPLCYDLAEFEHTNGKLLNTGDDVKYQRGLGSCRTKVSNPPGFSCPQGK